MHYEPSTQVPTLGDCCRREGKGTGEPGKHVCRCVCVCVCVCVSVCEDMGFSEDDRVPSNCTTSPSLSSALSPPTPPLPPMQTHIATFSATKLSPTGGSMMCSCSTPSSPLLCSCTSAWTRVLVSRELKIRQASSLQSPPSPTGTTPVREQGMA